MGIYFLEAEGFDLIKVGCTRYVRMRIQTLQCWSPAKLSLLAHVPGGFPDEKKIHYLLRDHRAQGEWFRRNPYLTAGIQFSADTGELPLFWQANEAERKEWGKGKRFRLRPAPYPELRP